MVLSSRYMFVRAKSLQSCPTLCNAMDCSLPDSWLSNSPGKNTGVGCHALFQGIFPTLGANLVKQSLYQLSHQGILSSRCLRQFVKGEPLNQLSDGNQAWHRGMELTPILPMAHNLHPKPSLPDPSSSRLWASLPKDAISCVRRSASFPGSSWTGCLMSHLLYQLAS